MTPDPRGYPHKSPLYDFLPTSKLTDTKIKNYALQGYYGRNAQQLYLALDKLHKITKPKLKTKSKCNPSSIQRQVDQLLKD